MATRNLLFKRQYKINDFISIYIPTVGEILEGIDDNGCEDDYYGLVSSLTAMPIDLMVQLDDIGQDFTQINEYELFLSLFRGVQSQDTRLIFGDLDISKFELALDEQSQMLVYLNPETGAKIDRAIHEQIANALRFIHHFEKNTKTAGNEEARKYLIERARKKQRRARNRQEASQLESLIVAMVNTEQYKYGFEETKELSIYQFNESVRQVIKKVDYDNKMYGIYTGTISTKDLSQDDLNWLVHK